MVETITLFAKHAFAAESQWRAAVASPPPTDSTQWERMRHKKQRDSPSPLITADTLDGGLTLETGSPSLSSSHAASFSNMFFLLILTPTLLEFYIGDV